MGLGFRVQGLGFRVHEGWGLESTHRLHSSSFLGFIFRIL